MRAKRHEIRWCVRLQSLRFGLMVNAAANPILRRLWLAVRVNTKDVNYRLQDVVERSPYRWEAPTEGALIGTLTCVNV